MARRPINTAALDLSGTLETIIAAFRERFPDKWQELRLCPLQHGLDDMVEALRHGK